MNRTVFFQFGLRASFALSVAGVLSSCAAKLNVPIPLEDGVPLVTQNGFTLSPTTQTISIGGTVSFSASGGAEPYTFDVYYGQGAIQSASGLFTAPQSPGDAVVRASDSAGAMAYAGVLFTDAPVIGPASLTLAAGNGFSFSVTGGTQPYAFSVVSGGGSIEASSGRFTAPGSPATVVVRVTDAKGRSSDATVTINAALAISPKNATIAVSGSQNFTASGGAGGLVYNVVSGAGAIDPATGVFSASPVMGTAVVRVVDTLGNSDFAIVTMSNPLRINPPQITIAKSTAYSFSSSGGKPSYTYSVLSGAHGAVVSTTGVYTAPASAGGPFTVTVTDAEGQSSSASVTVTESLSFNLPNVTLMVNDTFDFATIASGGVGSVSYTVPSSQGSFSGSSYTAPAIPGIYTVTAQDSQLPTPNTAQATVIVNPALAISPSSVTLAVNNTRSFSASGGVPPYSYTASSGSIDSSGIFSAPSSAGAVTITVTDARSHPATASVTVNAVLSISPSSKTMTAGSSFDFDVAGGVSPYTFSVASGGGSVVSSSGVYSAPGAPGMANLRVTDSIGNTVDSALTIVAPLAISPSNLSLLKSTGIVFSGSGGLPPYAFSVLTGGGTLSASTGAYTAPASAGLATIQVTDALGGTALASVTIYDGLAISPFTKTLIVNQAFSFSANGGVAPYNYSVLSGGGSINASSGTYTAPATAGSATVRVTDSQGNTTDASVTINAVLAISPASKTLAVNNSATFSASGGIAPYTFSVFAGGGTINASSGDYTAPATSGSATVRVTDSSGNTADASVTINGAIAITPASKSMVAGSSFGFGATGGVGGYIYSVSSSSGGDGSFSGATYTAPGAPGSATVRVTDTLGNYSEASVTIYEALAISPSSKTLAVSNSYTFTASGGLLPYTFTKPSGSGSVTTGGIYTASATSSSATVRVTDSAGNTSDASVTINSAVSISPTSATVAAGGTQSFSATDGVGPYAYAVISGGGSFSGAIFTAPSTAAGAAVTVRVTDSIGNTADATVTVPAITLAISSPSAASYITNSNKASFPVSGTCSENGELVTVSSAGVTSATPSCSGATWNTTLNFTSVADGPITITADYSNINGVAATQASVSLAKDTTLPTVTIGAPGVASYVTSSNQTAITVSGSCSESGRDVTITAGAVSATPSCSGASFTASLDLSSLSDGPVTITADHADNASNGATQASVGVTKDTAVPAPASINDGSLTNSTSISPTISWATISDAGSGLARYEVAAGTTPGGIDIAGWTDMGSTPSKQFAGLSLSDGVTYYGSVRAVDLAGNTSSVTQGNGWTVDATPPSAPGTISLGAAPANPLRELPTLTFAESTDTGGSGVAKYQIQVYNSSGPTLVRDWTDVSPSGSGTLTLNYGEGSDFLVQGTSYFARIRAVDTVQNNGTETQSGSWTVSNEWDCVDGTPARGSLCVGGSVYVGLFNGEKHMTTPSGCTNSSTPTCAGETDTLTKTWYGIGGYAADIATMENIASTATRSTMRGDALTALLVADASNGTDSAADYCNDLVYGGYSDWYLPSKSELTYMYCHSNGGLAAGLPQEDPNCGTYGGKTSELTGFAGWANYYWSSSEVNTNAAANIHFGDGNEDIGSSPGNGYKYVAFLVRCTRHVDKLPNTFSFPAIPSAPLSQDQESSTVTLTGFEGQITVSVSGASGSPQIAKSTDGGTSWSAWASSVTAVPDNWIKLKVSVGAVEGQNYLISVTAGSAVAVSWDVTAYSSDPCVGNPAIGTACEGGALYMGQFDGGKYMVMPSGCGDIPAGSVSGGSGYTSYALSDFTPIGGCSGGPDTLTKYWNDSSSNWYYIPGVEAFTTATASSSSYRGSVNTAAIVAITSGAQGGYHAAARYCDKLNYGGYTDWYLPSKSELAYLYCHAQPAGTHNTSYPQENPNCTVYGGKTSDLTGFVAAYYWASTEYSGAQAWDQNFSNGAQDLASSKNNYRFVRCVRRF